MIPTWERILLDESFEYELSQEDMNKAGVFQLETPEMIKWINSMIED